MMTNTTMTERSNIAAMAPLIAAEVFEIEAALVAQEAIATTRAVLLKLTDAYGVEEWGVAARAVLVDESHVRRLTAANFRLGARL
jgi:hypothetical protein